MQTIQNRHNRLTAYGLACGYVEKKSHKDVETSLWMEGGVYHVRQHDHQAGKRIFWETFEKLTDARKLFNKQKGAIRR